ncbi:amidohydrolase [Salinibacter sp. 10B]|uniref:amidohydrolase family protein n=1 Tax=Salinibacter sp. 10B TaxID=1923971 RepID=UPI000CF38713|nr:amidohydrolase family protein [Salinibacter sp. 10B]PQJ34514.1 amidohydrolase [Salinibacter sp. 10B]
MRPRILLFAVLCLCLTLPVQAQEQPHVFRNATLYPISSDPIENGTMVVQGGTIQAVGEAGAVDVPDGAVTHDVAGKVIMPGLVDTHSHIGQVSGGDGSAALHPDVRTIDAINVRHPSMDRARAGGITTVQVLSGSGHLMSGQTTFLKLRDGGTVGELNACDDRPVEECGGMKMANGTNPQRESGSFPGTRARAAAMAREAFVEAQAYRRKKQQAETEADMPDRDLRMEGLVDVLEGERAVHFHTHRHDDILTAIRLSDEFDFDLVLHHVSEGWKVAEEIAEANVPASIIVLDSPGGKKEADELVYRTGRVLNEAGVDVAYHTDDPITDSRLLLRQPAIGVRAGMSREAALESVTLAGARMLGMEDEIGSLDEGKDADFVVLSGDPLSVYTNIQQTWVEGTVVFDRSNPEDRDFATGGYRVYDDAVQHVHN